MFNLEELIKVIHPALEESKEAYGRNMYLVIGQTGAGKSTTINYLHRYPMISNDEGNAVPLDPAIPMPCHAADTGQAVTLVPKTVILQQERGEVVCDCPGFEDNRGQNVRISVSVCTEAVVKNAQSIQGLMVVIEWGTLTAVRAKGFREIAKTIASLLRGDSNFDCSHSLMFVITKCESRVKNPLKSMKEKIIPNSIRKLESDIQQLQTRLQLSDTNFLTRGQNTREKDQKTELDDFQSALAILRLMEAQFDGPRACNIVTCDVFDDGESRDNILNAMRRLDPIPKEVFDFSDVDDDRRNFTNGVRNEMVHAVKTIQTVGQLPSEIAAINGNYEVVSRELTLVQSQMKKLESGNFSPGEKDSMVQENRQILEDNQAKIMLLTNELETLDQSMRNAERKLAALDVSDEMIFAQLTYDESRLDHVGDLATQMMRIGLQEAERAKGYLSAVAIGSWWTITGLAMSPFVMLGSTVSRMEKTLAYNGAPFTRVDERGYQFNRKQYEPSRGIYIANYQSERCSGAQAYVTIYGEKRNIPDNKTQIQILKQSLIDHERRSGSLQNEITATMRANDCLKDVIRGLLVENQISIEKDKLNYGRLIKEKQAALIRLEGDRQEKRDLLSKLDTQLIVQRPFFEMVMTLSGFINFNSDAYPRIVQMISHYMNPISSISDKGDAFFSRSAGSKGVTMSQEIKSSMLSPPPPPRPGFGL